MSSDALVSVVQQHLRELSNRGFDMTGTRHVDIAGKPYHATKRTLDLYEGYLSDNIHHSSAKLWLPSENLSIVEVGSGLGAKQTKESPIHIESHVPSVITNLGNPYDEGSSAYHYSSRGWAAEQLKENPNVKKDSVDRHKLDFHSTGTSENGTITRLLPYGHMGTAPYEGSIHDFINDLHTLPQVHYSRPDFGNVEQRSMMTPEQLHHFFAGHRAFPTSDLTRMQFHHPDYGYSPDMGIHELGSDVPRGTIHIRHNQSTPTGNKVDHYAYDPTEETLNHLVTKEED
jgi:hypothetical protein